MNTAGLRAAFAKNKTALGIAGAVLVGALALRARSKTGTSSSSSAPAVATSGLSATPSYYTAGNPAATGFDSTASDVYNALQPQLERLNSSVGSLQNTIPVPSGSTTPTAQEFVRKIGDTRVYEAMSDGTLKTIDHADWAAAGSPTWSDLPASDPVWSRPASTTTSSS